MEQQCFKYITDAIAHWDNADVRTVPGVMYQIRCGVDEIDPMIEYQINWFIDCAETYVHNHRHSFVTLCLEGEYHEKIWTIVANNTGASTFRFSRESGNIIGAPEEISGALCHVTSRHHFPGNQMHVGIDHFHSIAPILGSSSRVFTFLAKRKHTQTPNTYILSSSSVIEEPNDAIRRATEEERENMLNKIQEILVTRFEQ